MAISLRLRLVLLPGFDGTGELFAPFYEMLPEGTVADMVRYRPDTPQKYAETAKRVFERLPRDEPFVIVAESYSGPIGALVAARAERDGLPIKGLAFSASFVRRPAGPIKSALVDNLIVRTYVKGATPLWAIGLLGLNGCDDFAVRHRAEALLVRAAAQIPGATRLQRFRNIFDTDATAALKQTRVPVLYLAGRRDRLMGTRGWQQVRDARLDAVRVDIDGPHMLMQANAKACRDALFGWMEGLR